MRKRFAVVVAVVLLSLTAAVVRSGGPTCCQDRDVYLSAIRSAHSSLEAGEPGVARQQLRKALDYAGE